MITKITLHSFGLSVLLLSMVGSTSAQQLILESASDGIVVDQNGDEFFDTANSATAPSAIDQTLFGGPEFRGILEFETSAIPTGSILTSVVFNAGSSSFDTNDAEFFLYSGDGDVNVQDATGGSRLGTFDIPAFPATYTQSFDVFEFQSLLDNSATHFGIRFESDDATNVAFFGADNAAANSAVPPTLTVYFVTVPEPSGLLPAFLAITSLVLRRKRFT